MYRRQIPFRVLEHGIMFVLVSRAFVPGVSLIVVYIPGQTRPRAINLPEHIQNQVPHFKHLTKQVLHNTCIYTCSFFFSLYQVC